MKALETTKTYAAVAALAVALVLVVTACGGGGSSSAEASGSNSSAGSGAQEVSVSDVGGFNDVLVDPQGKALYASDEETARGSILCKTNACLAFWDPLTLPSPGSAPSGDPAVDGKLGTTTRPDGTRQVTFEGKPLYSFTEDAKPGDVTGDGFQDSFGGQDFTWHVATLSGASAPGMTTTRDRFGY
jgi:predicted lipoprotein with Yx(FWY)xxD motif